MRVPLLDLARSNAPASQAVAERVQAVFASEQFILGPFVAEFEEAMRDFLGGGHAIGMSSGTDAELAILMALGIGPGDAVITTPFTFFATAGCIHRLGAEIVFADIDPVTFHLGPESLRECVESRCRTDGQGNLRTPAGNRVKAIMPVHLFGLCCPMREINALAAKHGLAVIEDASQAIGTQSPEGQRAGTLADSAFFSFFPTKNLGGAGDGGLAVCRGEEMAARLRLLRNHGMEERYYHRVVGGNFRLDALQAAVLLAKLPFLDGWNAARRKSAEIYRQAFAAAKIEGIVLPAEPWRSSGRPDHHIYHQFVIRAPRRDELGRHLEKEGVGHGVYYPVPLHRQECFARFAEPAMPQAEQAAREVLALPIFPGLTESEISQVVEAITGYYRE